MIETTLRAREAERARCLQAQDEAGLRALFSTRLQHVHTRGRIDDLEAYLRFTREVAQVLEISRGPLAITPLGDDAALMTGRQSNRSRDRATGAELITEALVSQVWAREADGVWRQVLFHGTALPPTGAPR